MGRAFSYPVQYLLVGISSMVETQLDFFGARNDTFDHCHSPILESLETHLGPTAIVETLQEAIDTRLEVAEDFPWLGVLDFSLEQLFDISHRVHFVSQFGTAVADRVEVLLAASLQAGYEVEQLLILVVVLLANGVSHLI